EFAHRSLTMARIRHSYQRSTVCLGLTIAGAAGLFSLRVFSQPNTNPFWDHTDTGETVHVLPTPASIRSPRETNPTDAAATGRISVYPASYGSGNLTNHKGNIISSAQFYAVYWNSNVANSTGSLGYKNIQNQITQFVSNFSGSPDYTIVQQYTGANGGITSSIPFAGDYVDSQSPKSMIKDSAIRSYLAGLFQASRLTPKANALYGIYFPSGMKVQLSGGLSCSSFCGYHSHFTYNGVQIKYAVFPYPDCGGCSLSGKSVADMLTIVSSHEIREAVTDPGDNNVNAWYDASGYEADDKCAWHNLYQMTGGFWIQPEYSNAHSGCVVP
ncbi:MAG: hypothetical protein ABI822_09250, partial [Bryobacteraceae bacterium]